MATTRLYAPRPYDEFDSGVAGVAPILSTGTDVDNTKVTAVQAAATASGIGTLPTSAGGTAPAPVAEPLRFRGPWQISTVYSYGDVVSQGGSLYVAPSAFTSGSSFVAGNWTKLGPYDATDPSFSATYVPSVAPGIFPVGNYSSLQAACDAASAAGGGFVMLSLGANAAPATKITLGNRVVIGQPFDAPMSVWGYNTDPRPFHSAWIEAAAGTDPVIEIPSTVVNAGLSNVMIHAGGRRAVNVVSSANRGGNRLDNVYAHGGDIYVGQLETRMSRVIVMAAPGAGLTIDAQDCELDHAIVGFCGGDGITLTTASGPLRGATFDTFDNTGNGLVINGSGHRLFSVQSNSNNKTGVVFATATDSQIALISATDNGREYDGATHTTRYPNVDFAHPTAGNVGCAVLGGKIANGDTLGTLKQDCAVRNSETVISYPRVANVTMSGFYATAGGGNSPFQLFSSFSAFSRSGNVGAPDMVVPQGGVAPQFRPNGTIDQWQATDGSGAAYTGVTYQGRLYVKVSGAPSAGTWAVGDSVRGSDGRKFVCVVAGTPGTWAEVNDYEDLLSAGEGTVERTTISATTVAMGAAGTVVLQYFTARKSETCVRMRVRCGSQAAAGSTLTKFGVYSVDPATSALTLIASTASDTTLLSATSTEYSPAFSASFTKQRGQRYAAAVITVGATTLPQFTGMGIQSGSLYARAPRMAASLAAQTDLPASIADASLASPSGLYYFELLPT